MLGRFERLLEEAVEGGLRRVFPVDLQPVQLAKAAARAMEEAQVIGLQGAEVPNNYVLRVAPDDLQRFEDYRSTLAGRLERYLTEYAAERGLIPVGEPRVQVVEDESVRAGTVRADARFVDIEPARREALEEAISGTRALRLAAPDEPGTAWLEDSQKRRFALNPAEGVVRVGRSLENDIVIADTQVSRYHAQLRWDGRAWLIQDLGSTNGTFIGKQRLGESAAPLRRGAPLRLGQYELAYRVQGGKAK